jgi:hypothetical protein
MQGGQRSEVLPPMPRLRSEHELETLRQRQVELAKRIAAAEATARAKAKEEERRRQLIAGAAALEQMAAEPQSPFAAMLLSLINRRARSAADRALFNLPPAPRETETVVPAERMNGSDHAGN